MSAESESPLVVSVFGGSRWSAGSEPYQMAYQLGTLIARNGYTLLSGGYNGVMEASCRGATDAGGRVRAVAHAPWGAPNRYVHDYTTAPDLFRRVQALVETASAFVALPGGMGTVSEVALVWVLLQANLLPLATPLILVGRPWRAVLGTWKTELTLSPDDLKLVKLVDTPDEAVDYLNHWRAK